MLKYTINCLSPKSKSWGEFLWQIRTFNSTCVYVEIYKAGHMPRARYMLREELRRLQSFTLGQSLGSVQARLSVEGESQNKAKVQRLGETFFIYIVWFWFF